jgi:hypothetical protein
MRLALAPKAVEVEDEEVEDEVVDVVSIKHNSDKKLEKEKPYAVHKTTPKQIIK